MQAYITHHFAISTHSTGLSLALQIGFDPAELSRTARNALDLRADHSRRTRRAKMILKPPS